MGPSIRLRVEPSPTPGVTEPVADIDNIDDNDNDNDNDNNANARQRETGISARFSGWGDDGGSTAEENRRRSDKARSGTLEQLQGR
jgi:hypothetical protein